MNLSSAIEMTGRRRKRIEEAVLQYRRQVRDGAMDAFLSRHPASAGKGALVYGGTEYQKRSKGTVWPVVELAQMMAEAKGG